MKIDKQLPFNVWDFNLVGVIHELPLHAHFPLLCWFTRPRVNQNVSVQAASLNQHKARCRRQHSSWFWMGSTKLNNSINAEECNRNLVAGTPFDVQGELSWMGDDAPAKPRVSFAAIEQESARNYDSL